MKLALFFLVSSALQVCMVSAHMPEDSCVTDETCIAEEVTLLQGVRNVRTGNTDGEKKEEFEGTAAAVAQVDVDIVRHKDAESADGMSDMVQSRSKHNKLGSKKKLSLDDNQKVYIENQPILGDGAGEGALGVCREMADMHIRNPEAPRVKVCGTNIRAIFFLRRSCQDYYEHHRIVGACNTGQPPSTCDAFSPAQDPRFGHYQSYLIESCSQGGSFARSLIQYDGDHAPANGALQSFPSENSFPVENHPSLVTWGGVLDSNQKVYIEHQPVLGDGAGNSAFEECRRLPEHILQFRHPDFAVQVCGTRIKATFFLRPECGSYHEQIEVGQCNLHLEPWSCDFMSANMNRHLLRTVSYRIEKC